MGMEYKLAVKIMDNVIKGYLKDREYNAGVLMVGDRKRNDDPISDAYGKVLWEEGLHADQITEAYNRIRNG